MNTPLYDLTIAKPYVMTTPERVQSARYCFLKVHLTAIPQYFLAGAKEKEWPEPSAAPFDYHWVFFLHQALWSRVDETPYYTWCRGIMAAFALTAKAHLHLNDGRLPTLKELLPGAFFSHSDVERWLVDVAQRSEFRRCATAADLFIRTGIELDVLYRHSDIPLEEAVEGSLELLMPDGKRALGWTKHMIIDSSTPTKKALTLIDEGRQFHEKHRSRREGCLLVFCTGDAEECFEELQAFVAKKEKKSYLR